LLQTVGAVEGESVDPLGINKVGHNESPPAGGAVKDFENFDLLVSKTPEGYKARVRDPRRDAVALRDFRFPFQAGELENLSSLRTTCRDIRSELSDPEQTLQSLGARLFEAVFAGKIEVSWRRHLDRAGDEGKALRLRLRWTDAEVSEWPWEYLYDSERGFLGHSPQTPIVRRYLEMSTGSRPLRVLPPLPILVAVPQPPGWSPLDVAREWRELKGALQDLEKSGQVHLERLASPTLKGLQAKLMEPFHVFHFIGHGSFDRERGEGSLLFEDENGQGDPVDARRLRIVLAHRQLRLVVLNACEGARGSPANAFAGLAQRLIEGQVPAVVAMQFKISDAAAISFARHFYANLAKRLPVDVVVSETRNAMFTDGHTVEWGSPVLYLRALDGRIFERSWREVWVEKVQTARAFLAKDWQLVVLLVGALLLLGLLLAARTLDPNLLYSWLNPPECPSPPGLRIAFVLIKPGTFMMGSDGGHRDQRPAHPVTITRPFCLARFETTQAQWKKVRGEPPRQRATGGRLPVANVSWDDAKAFLDTLNRVDPQGRYRFPTEAEWEYAVRAGTRGRYSFGDDPGDLAKYANCRSKEESDGYEATAPVGSFRRNPWGLFDMYGNVSEWVVDWAGPYPSGPVSDPTGPATGEEKVRRGGSFNYTTYCDSIYRNSSKPETRNEAYGFRIVRDPAR
jgi:formylglycine-generating enzyme required for sulfatase activity